MLNALQGSTHLYKTQIRGTMIGTESRVSNSVYHGSIILKKLL